MLTIQHAMDDHPREMTLDNAFLEALSLSEGCANEIEARDTELLQFLNKHPEFIKNVTAEFKRSVLEAWDYTII